MTDGDRSERLAADQMQLEKLQANSDILRFVATGDPPDRFNLTLQGKGLAKTQASQGSVEVTDRHQIDVRCPYAYPRVPPDIRWVTPIFHPNVSFSGFIHLSDVGLPWSPAITMEQICERLWDIARFAYAHLERTTNFQARSWVEEQEEFTLPVDERSLCRDSSSTERHPNKNVIKYDRRDADASENIPPDRGVFYIGEDTPLPPARRQIRPSNRPSNRPGNDEDILYIGDD